MKIKKASEGTLIQKSDYSKKIIFDYDDFDQKGHLLQTVIIPANTTQRAHFHNLQTEIWYILEGESYFYVNDIEYFVEKGDAMIGKPKEVHYVVNKTNQDCLILVFKIDKPIEGDDTVWLE